VPEREYRVFIHEEDGGYWAEVEGLPGCFASGSDLDELREAVVEAITLYSAGEDQDASRQAPVARGRVDEMRVLVPASR
jgi:predicted RNase H-like HicB family nuclease